MRERQASLAARHQSATTAPCARRISSTSLCPHTLLELSSTPHDSVLHIARLRLGSATSLDTTTSMISCLIRTSGMVEAKV
eukprot:593301-Amphidinium_carterae.1